MGIELRQPEGTFLSGAEVETRLSNEFRFVVVDAQEGQKHAQRRADWIESAPPRIFLGRQEEALRHAARLRRLKTGEAVVVKFGDTADLPVSLIVVPGEPLMFGFESPGDRAALTPLIVRCATALGCQLIEF